MSAVLLDTHTLLWAFLSPELLRQGADAAIADSDTDAYFSIVSIWEIGIKASSGKLTLVLPMEEIVRQAIVVGNFRLLPIEVTHVSQMMLLPFHHRDPFDRLLVGQSLAERLPLVSKDIDLDAYGIQRIW